MLVNNEHINMRSRKKSKDNLNKLKWEHNNPKSMGHSKICPKREIHSIKSLSQETKISSINK